MEWEPVRLEPIQDLGSIKRLVMALYLIRPLKIILLYGSGGLSGNQGSKSAQQGGYAGGMASANMRPLKGS